MAAIAAGRAARKRGSRCGIAAFDGARKLGAKILVSGGGRCNVTHESVDESAYSGSSPAAIRKVLRQFGAADTVRFFRELGVELKREETGKLFPTTDDARTVLDALVRGARDCGVELRHPERMEAVRAPAEGDGRFCLTSIRGEVQARRVILATGGRSYPKTGSDGHGYEIARSLGHSITPLVLPALVPLMLEPSCYLRGLSGLTVPATIELRSARGRRLAAITGSTLCTHFGLSGPSVLDVSRHYVHAASQETGARLFINWLPGETAESVETMFVDQARRAGASSVGRCLEERLPQRLVAAVCGYAGIDRERRAATLSRGQRRGLAAALTSSFLPVTGDRGFGYAEVTAGGVPLKELRLETMESRVCPGLFLCGEICDVDGRIGGYNFQWAWSSGQVAGIGAAASP